MPSFSPSLTSALLRHRNDSRCPFSALSVGGDKINWRIGLRHSTSYHIYSHRRSHQNHPLTRTHPSANSLNSATATTMLWGLMGLACCATIASASRVHSDHEQELGEIHRILEKLYVPMNFRNSSFKYHASDLPKMVINEVRKFKRSNPLPCHVFSLCRTSPNITFLLAGI